MFYAQVNPLYMKFDVDTVIWLNAFLLNLMANLVSLIVGFYLLIWGSPRYATFTVSIFLFIERNKASKSLNTCFSNPYLVNLMK